MSYAVILVLDDGRLNPQGISSLHPTILRAEKACDAANMSPAVKAPHPVTGEREGCYYTVVNYDRYCDKVREQRRKEEEMARKPTPFTDVALVQTGTLSPVLLYPQLLGVLRQLDADAAWQVGCEFPDVHNSGLSDPFWSGEQEQGTALIERLLEEIDRFSPEGYAFSMIPRTTWEVGFWRAV